MQGEEYGHVYNLNQLLAANGRILTVGRQQGNVIFIKSDYTDYLSRFHCTIETSPDLKQWAIRDGQWRRDLQKWVGSSNGTFVNSIPVTQNGYFLKPGDIIAIGDVTLRFETF